MTPPKLNLSALTLLAQAATRNKSSVFRTVPRNKSKTVHKWTPAENRALYIFVQNTPRKTKTIPWKRIPSSSILVPLMRGNTKGKHLLKRMKRLQNLGLWNNRLRHT